MLRVDMHLVVTRLCPIVEVPWFPERRLREKGLRRIATDCDGFYREDHIRAEINLFLPLAARFLKDFEGFHQTWD
jgi:hypothetical protein